MLCCTSTSCRGRREPNPTFFKGTIEKVLTSCLTVWYRKTLQWIVITARSLNTRSLGCLCLPWTPHTPRPASAKPQVLWTTRLPYPIDFLSYHLAEGTGAVRWLNNLLPLNADLDYSNTLPSMNKYRYTPALNTAASDTLLNTKHIIYYIINKHIYIYYSPSSVYLLSCTCLTLLYLYFK